VKMGLLQVAGFMIKYKLASQSLFMLVPPHHAAKRVNRVGLAHLSRVFEGR